jgi:hypothetical protein
VLKNIWFSKLADTADHAERLEGFYKGQAHACERAAAESSGGPRSGWGSDNSTPQQTPDCCRHVPAASALYPQNTLTPACTHAHSSCPPCLCLPLRRLIPLQVPVGQAPHAGGLRSPPARL